MLNCVVLMGRLVRDPELRTTQTGISVLSFTIAVDRPYAKQGEERQTDFIDIVAWRQTAEFINRFFHKGSLIAVQGALQTRNYENKNGIKRKAFEVVVDKVSFCGPKSESAAANRIEEMTANEPEPAFSNAEPDDFETLADDDLPF